jgi:methyl coenzyme M reductase gamma subunit
MSYEVRREIEAVGTANAASEGAARSDATATVVSAIEAADEGELVSVAVTAASVYDFPAAPFDPYRFHLTTTVAVTVDAADEASAVAAGTEDIDDLLGRADLDEWEYVGDAELEAPA